MKRSKTIEHFMKLRILDKSNELLKSIARPMLRPLGSNACAIEFGEPTVRCNPWEELTLSKTQSHYNNLSNKFLRSNFFSL